LFSLAADRAAIDAAANRASQAKQKALDKVTLCFLQKIF